MANNFSGEVLHFGSYRSRISGNGNFLSTFNDIDGANQNELPVLALSNAPGTEPLILSDFIGQRGQLTGYMLNINEYFNISKITIYIRPIASGLPQ